MASRSKQRTTMAKHTRERAVKEKREEKEIRKAARKLAAAAERRDPDGLYRDEASAAQL